MNEQWKSKASKWSDKTSKNETEKVRTSQEPCLDKKTRLINFWFKSSSKPSVCLVWWYNIKVQYLSTYDFEFTQGHRGNNAWFIGAESRSTQKLRKIIYSLLKSSEILVKILVKNDSWAQKGRTSHHSENTHRRMLDEERGITEIYNRSD